MRRAFRLEVGRQRVERDVDSELAFHLAMRAERLVARGMSPEAARREALRQFGDVAAIRTECVTLDREREKTMRRLMRFDDLRQDAAYALRSLRQRPGFTAIVLLILALGIGANTAMFSLVDALMLRTLPVSHPEQLVTLTDPSRTGGISMGSPRTDLLSYPLWKDLQERSRGLLTDAYASGTTTRLDVLAERAANGGVAAGTQAEHPRGRFVSGGYWSTLGLRAARGRVFGTEADAGAGAAPVAVISHGWWTRRFGADPSVVGRTITVNDVPLTIIGIAPEDFTGDIVGQRIDLWLPITLQPLLSPERQWLDRRDVDWILVMGRLAPGVSIERVRAELVPFEHRTILAHVEGDDLGGVQGYLREHPMKIESGARGFSPFRRVYGTALATLSAAVALVLLVVCANVANLMLARATARSREMSVRLAIGASRQRLLQQLLVESAILGLLGGALGIAVGWFGSGALVRLASSGPDPIPLGVRADGRVLAFTALLSVGTAILFGLVPALHATRVELATALRGTAGAVTGGARSRMRIGRTLVVAQVGLSLLLLVATGMLVRSMQRMDDVDLGFARDRLVIARIDASRHGYVGAKVPPLVSRYLERVQALPGVAGATVSMNGIFSGTQSNSSITVEGFVARTQGDSISDFDMVGPNYFRTIGARLLRGRDILPTDVRESERVAVVNESFARHFFPGGDAIGRRLSLDTTAFQIVGVVGDVQGTDLRGEPAPRFYIPKQQEQVDRMFGDFVLLVRTTGDPARMVEPLRRTLQGVAPEIEVSEVDALPSKIQDSVRQDRLVARVVALFGVLTLVLASLGLYGVMAYATARRIREFGLRMALGATRGAVARLVLGDALLLLAAGLVVGLPAALGAVRLIRGQLFGVDLVDPPSIALAILALGASILVAGYLPAARAARVEPNEALRGE